jgi:D-alanyl-D-alanine carboxypeptidase
LRTVFAAVWLAVSVCASVFAAPSPEPSPGPGASEVKLSAKSAVLLDCGTGRVLFEKDPDTRRGIASLTKIMTAVVALKHSRLDELVGVTAESAGLEGSSMYLKAGDVLSVRELLTGLLLRSGNDAARALSLHCAGSEENFAALMNEQARILGLKDTHFRNPHGLDDEQHYSTARDMAVLAAYAMRDPTFRELAGSRSLSANGQPLRNHNKLLHLYEGACGVKTGYTRACGRCLAGAAERDGRMLVAVTLDDPDDWNDHARLFDLGFDKYPLRTVEQGGVLREKVPVFGGGYARARLGQPIRAALRGDEVGRLKRHVELPGYVWAGFRGGDYAGRVRYEVDGRTVADGALYWIAAQERQEERNTWNGFKKSSRRRAAVPGGRLRRVSPRDG